MSVSLEQPNDHIGNIIVSWFSMYTLMPLFLVQVGSVHLKCSWRDYIENNSVTQYILFHEEA